MATQWIYHTATAQAELSRTLGRPATPAEMRALLGARGAWLAELAGMGLPVPPAFILTTEACMAYLDRGAFPDGLWPQALAAVQALEMQLGKRFGDPVNPLILSVQTSTRHSSPGMMEAILYLGLNDTTCAALANLMGNAQIAYTAYGRFIASFARAMMGHDSEAFEAQLDDAFRTRADVLNDTAVSLEALLDVKERCKALYKSHFDTDFPTDPYRQLELALAGPFRAWTNRRAVDFRHAEGLPDDLGVAAVVLPMLFGNFGSTSAVGCVFSRNPQTGERLLFGEILFNSTFEDLFSSVSASADIQHLGQTMPQVYARLIEIAQQLEAHYRDMQDLEFVIEQERLWLTTTRSGKRSTRAAVKIAVDLVREGLISREEAVLRVSPQEVQRVPHLQFDPLAVEQARTQGALLARGTAAAPGVAVGRLALDADTAEKWAQSDCASILVCDDFKPDDIHGILATQGVLCGYHRPTSSVAIFCWSWNKPAIMGLESLVTDVATRTVRIGESVLREGETISIDGNTGEIFLGQIPQFAAAPDPELQTLLEWGHQIAAAAE